MIGSTISHYKILSKIGEGGMGIVYKAEDLRLHRTVALKFLPSDSVTYPNKERFIQEAQSAALIHHPNICPIYDIDEVDGHLFFAMAYLEGRTLLQVISDGPLSLGNSIQIALQIADGLETAHQHGIVHRDIKSNNIVVSQQGNASILDFGLALRSGNARLTLAGKAVGTPSYMSPEQAQGLALDGRTDIWSLGVVLFEMLTGHLPFHRDTAVASIYSIVHEKAPSVRDLRLEVPPELERVVQKALAKKPEDRWQTAAQMAAELRRMQQTLPEITQTQAMGTFVSGAVTNAGIAPHAVKPPLKRTPVKIAGATALLAAIIGAVVALHPWSTREKDLAVVPFQIIGSDELTQVLSDGLVETLTSKLTQVEELRGKVMVVPASEIRVRKILSAEDARRIYGVNLAITGSVQRTSDRIQFNVTLVDATKMRSLRSTTFDFNVDNPISHRDEAVRDVVRLLELELTPAEQRSVAAGETTVSGAYTDYLKGRGYLSRYDVQGNIDHAMNSFESAVKQDPNYALAYAGLAEAYWWKAQLSSEKHWSDLALQNAEKAVTLAGTLVAARVKLGEIYGGIGRHDEAIREIKHALDLAPGNADAYRTLAEVYTANGQYQDAEGMYRQAISRHPNDWYGHLLLGLFYYQRARYGEAETAFEAAAKLTPGNVVVYRNLATVYMRQGRYKDAEARLQEALKIERTARIFGTLGMAYYYERRFAEAASALEEATKLDPSIYYLWGNLGTVRHWSATPATAEPAFRKAIELGEKALEVTPKDNSIRSNLAEYYAKLAQPQKALDEIAKIPEEFRARFAVRLALVYELGGDRKKAIETVQTSHPGPDSVTEIRDDPYLAPLWKDPAFQQTLKK